jgi:hypothetical protein
VQANLGLAEPYLKEIPEAKKVLAFLQSAEPEHFCKKAEPKP